MDGPIVPIEAFSLVPEDADEHAHHRLGRFQDGMAAWHTPGLKAYRDAVLSNGKARATVATYLTTARGRCSEIPWGEGTREALSGLASRTLWETEQADTPAECKAFLIKMVNRLGNATDSRSVLVKTKTHQDYPDADHLRMTAEQAPALMAVSGLEALQKEAAYAE
jgi:hypothetical protein